MTGGSQGTPLPDFTHDFSGFDLTIDDGAVYHFDRDQGTFTRMSTNMAIATIGQSGESEGAGLFESD